MFPCCRCGQQRSLIHRRRWETHSSAAVLPLICWITYHINTDPEGRSLLKMWPSPPLSSSVPGLPLGSDSEAKERPLAGASHPSSVHRLRQRAVWGSATQPATLHPTGPHARCPVPDAPGRLPHVRLHWCSRGAYGLPLMKHLNTDKLRQREMQSVCLWRCHL